MSVVRMDFEEGANGAGLILGTGASQSGFYSQTTGGASTLTYDIAHVHQGNRSIKVTPEAGQPTLGTVLADTAAFACETMIWIGSTPPNDTWLISGYDTSGESHFKVILKSSGRLSFATLTSTVLWTSTLDLPLGQWVRLSVYEEVGATNGTLRFDYFIGDSTVPAETGYAANGTAELTNNNFGQFRVGKANGSNYATPYWFDSVQYDDDPATASYIGPWSGAANGPYVWNGSQWVNHVAHVYDGSTWQRHDVVS